MASEPLLGGVFLFAGNFAPRGYAQCNGQILPIAQNTALFSLLGTTFGGNGQTTFALPDLRGRAAVGSGQGNGLQPIDLGEMAGQQSITLTVADLPAHTHSVTVFAAADGRPAADTPLGNVLDSGGPSIYTSALDTNTRMHDGMAVAGITGGNTAFNVLNPFLGLTYIIATEGIFPSRN